MGHYDHDSPRGGLDLVLTPPVAHLLQEVRELTGVWVGAAYAAGMLVSVEGASPWTGMGSKEVWISVY